ncbi:MAG: hypothetical protein ACOYMS_13345 [Terrimicrobiaceae bacterium]
MPHDSNTRFQNTLGFETFASWLRLAFTDRTSTATAIEAPTKAH